MSEFIVELDRELYSAREWETLTIGLTEVRRCFTCGRYGSVREGGIKFCRKHGHLAGPDGYCSWWEEGNGDD